MLLSLQMRPSHWSRFRRSHFVWGSIEISEWKGKWTGTHLGFDLKSVLFTLCWHILCQPFSLVKRKEKMHFSFESQLPLMQPQKVSKNQDHQKNTEHLKFWLCLVSPCTRPAQSLSYHNTTKSGASVFGQGPVTELCLQSYRDQGLQQDWDPKSLGSGPLFLPALSPSLFIEDSRIAWLKGWCMNVGSIEHTAWKNNQFLELLNWLNWKLCL